MRAECPFCEIDYKRTEVIDNRPLVYVAFSNPRLVEGHLLVIPRRHIEVPWGMLPDERIAVMDTFLEYQELITTRFSTGCDLKQNYRPFLPESDYKVNHVHYHIQPRDLNDELYQVSGSGENALWQFLTPQYKERFKILFGS